MFCPLCLVDGWLFESSILPLSALCLWFCSGMSWNESFVCCLLSKLQWIRAISNSWATCIHTSRIDNYSKKFTWPDSFPFECTTIQLFKSLQLVQFFVVTTRLYHQLLLVVHLKLSVIGTMLLKDDFDEIVVRRTASCDFGWGAYEMQCSQLLSFENRKRRCSNPPAWLAETKSQAKNRTDATIQVSIILVGRQFMRAA